MSESLLSSVSLSKIAMKLGGFIWEQITKNTPGLLRRFKDRLAAESAAVNYLARYLDAYGVIRPIGMTHSIRLEQIYTEVRLTTQQLRNDYGEESKEQELRDDLGGDSIEFSLRDLFISKKSEMTKSEDGIATANKYQRILVLGHPGGGKSTYLRRLGWECLRTHGIVEKGQAGEPHYAHVLLPVLLELRRYRSDEKRSLVELMAQELADCGFPESSELVEGMLATGKLLVLLDALDEVAQNQVQEVVGQVEGLVRRYPDCRFVISCRVAFRHRCFANFQDVMLLEFSDAQIGAYISNWFSAEEQRAEKLAEKLIELLNRPEHQATKELARSPVLISYLCVAFQCGLTLSSNRAEVYRRALDIYLREWNAHEYKMTHVNMVHPSLPHEAELSMLAHIAFSAMKNEQFLMSRDEWVACIRSFMGELVELPAALDAGHVLEKIAVSQGLVVQRTHQDWSFSHLTIQEYLAAHHIDQNNMVDAFVRENLGGVRWREVFLILAGMKPGPLLLAMIQTANCRLLESEPSWRKWMEYFAAWTSNESGLEDAARLLAIQLMGVAFHLEFAACITHSNAMVIARDLSRDLALALCGEFSFALDLSLQFTSEQVANLRNSAKIIRVGSSLLDSDLKTLEAILSAEVSADRKSRRKALRLLYDKDPAVFLPLPSNPDAVKDHFALLHFIFRCKAAAAKVPLRREWRTVLKAIF